MALKGVSSQKMFSASLLAKIVLERATTASQALNRSYNWTLFTNLVFSPFHHVYSSNLQRHDLGTSRLFAGLSRVVEYDVPQAGGQKSWQTNAQKLMSSMGNPFDYGTHSLLRAVLRLFRAQRIRTIGFGLLCGLRKPITPLS